MVTERWYEDARQYDASLVVTEIGMKIQGSLAHYWDHFFRSQLGPCIGVLDKASTGESYHTVYTATLAS